MNGKRGLSRQEVEFEKFDKYIIIQYFCVSYELCTVLSTLHLHVLNYYAHIMHPASPKNNMGIKRGNITVPGTQKGTQFFMYLGVLIGFCVRKDTDLD